MQYSSEQWKPVPGYEGYYEVSDHGRVRSVDRIVERMGHPKRLKGKALKLTPKDSGHLQVDLHQNGKRKMVKVHRLVLEAFVGPCPEGMEACHWDDNPENNHLSNLRWGTRTRNLLDRVRNGEHHNAKKTHCKHGHEFTPENTRLWVRPRTTARICLTCERESGRRKRQRRRASHVGG